MCVREREDYSSKTRGRRSKACRISAAGNSPSTNLAPLPHSSPVREALCVWPEFATTARKWLDFDLRLFAVVEELIFEISFFLGFWRKIIRIKG